MTRRWKPSMTVTTGDGLSWKVSRGTKSPNDLVLEVRTARGWRNVKMETGFLMADFLAENEDALVADGYFPSTAAGGTYYLNHLSIAVREGWQAATTQLDEARARRRNREGVPQQLRPQVIGGVHVCEWQRRDAASFVCIHCGDVWANAAAGMELF